jgi:hypothetical protein
MDTDSAPAGKSTLVALSLASMLVAASPMYAQNVAFRRANDEPIVHVFPHGCC